MPQNPTQVLESITSGRTFLKLKFYVTLQVASISKEKFTILKYTESPAGSGSYVLDATPYTVPLEDIIVRDDFDSIRKELMLHYDIDESLPPPGKYGLIINGDPDDPLRTASGEEIEFAEKLTDDATPVWRPVAVMFDYTYDNDPADDAIEEDPVVIQDFSIKDVSAEGAISPSSQSEDAFYIEESIPADGSLFVEKDYFDGSIVIRFSQRPTLSSLHNNNVKVQRKEINGTDFRWKTLPIKMALDADEPVLYIYVPSLDATPVYFSDGHEYFESGYKYRVILSKNITS